MRRRTFRITEEQDLHIEKIAARVGLDKEQVVRLALGVGLPVVDDNLEVDVTEKIGAQLKGAHSESIKRVSAKRRS